MSCACGQCYSKLRTAGPRDNPPPDPYASIRPPSASMPVVKDSNGIPDPYATAIAKKRTDAAKERK
jgi:hypothetical protein